MNDHLNALVFPIHCIRSHSNNTGKNTGLTKRFVQVFPVRSYGKSEQTFWLTQYLRAGLLRDYKKKKKGYGIAAFCRFYCVSTKLAISSSV